MTNKLQKKAQKSKLQVLNNNSEEKVFPLSRKVNASVRSFRLDEQSWKDLQATVEKINTVSQRKVSTSRLIKALIYLGKQVGDEKLLKALKEVSI